MERANAGDVEGLVALYEPDAVLALPGDEVAAGGEQICNAYRRLLAMGRTYTAEGQKPALVKGDLALTSTRILGGATRRWLGVNLTVPGCGSWIGPTS